MSKDKISRSFSSAYPVNPDADGQLCTLTDAPPPLQKMSGKVLLRKGNVKIKDSFPFSQ